MTTLDRILELISAEGLSPSNITDELGMSNSTFSDWKKGKGKPSIDALVKLSNRFDVSLDWLVFGKERVSANMVTFADPAERQLVNKFRKIPEDNRPSVMAYMDGILATVEADNKSSEKEVS